MSKRKTTPSPVPLDPPQNQEDKKTRRPSKADQLQARLDQEREKNSKERLEVEQRRLGELNIIREDHNREVYAANKERDRALTMVAEMKAEREQLISQANEWANRMVDAANKERDRMVGAANKERDRMVEERDRMVDAANKERDRVLVQAAELKAERDQWQRQFMDLNNQHVGPCAVVARELHDAQKELKKLKAPPGFKDYSKLFVSMICTWLAYLGYFWFLLIFHYANEVVFQHHASEVWQVFTGRYPNFMSSIQAHFTVASLMTLWNTHLQPFQSVIICCCFLVLCYLPLWYKADKDVSGFVKTAKDMVKPPVA